VALLLLVVSTWGGKSFGGSSQSINENFAGWVTFSTNQGLVQSGYFVDGNFQYSGTSKLTTGNGTATYDFSGESKTAYTASFGVFTDSTMQTEIYSDTFTGTNSGSYDHFNVVMAFKPSAYPTGTTMTVSADLGKNEALQQTSPLAFVMTLYNPTNTFDTGTYNASNLPLPDQTTINKYFTPTGNRFGLLVYDPDGLTFNTDVEYTWQNGTPPPIFNAIPEPSSLVMGLLALGICTAGFCVSRRSR